MTTSPGQVAGATQHAAGQTAGTARDEAAQVGSAAASAASDVAGTAKQQAGQVAGEAVNQLRSLTDQARAQAGEQAGAATDKLSTTVRSLAGEVRDLGEGKGDPSGTVAGLAQQLADRGEHLADYLSSQGPAGLVQDLRSYASRSPGTFLLGALAAGVVTGRLVKGATGSTSSSASSPGAAAPEPLPVTTGYEDDLAAPGAGSDLGTPYAGTSSTYLDEPATPYPGALPVVRSDDSGVLDDATTTVGPVSGDDRLIDEAHREPGTGLR